LRVSTRGRRTSSDIPGFQKPSSREMLVEKRLQGPEPPLNRPPRAAPALGRRAERPSTCPCLSGRLGQTHALPPLGRGRGRGRGACLDAVHGRIDRSHVNLPAR